MKILFETGKHAAPLPEQKSQTLTLNAFLDLLEAENRVYSGEQVTPQNAMKCTTIQGIVRALTNAIGSYPVSVGQTTRNKSGITIEDRPDHAVNKLLLAPNIIQTNTEFYRMIVQHIALYGNFYALKGQANTGPISYLRPIEDPTVVSVDDVNWNTGVTYKVNFKGGDKFLPQKNVVHITSGILDSDGVSGKSPVELCRQAIGICLAAEKLIAQLYGNNDVPTMALIGGMFRSEEDYDLWKTKFKEARGQASDGRGGTLLLPEGMSAKEMSFKPIDAQLLEMRKFQRIEIAQVYGVPPHKLADLERATFSNIEEQSLEFVRDVAKPWVRLIAQALTRDLFRVEDRRAGYIVRFDMEDATEGKLNERLDAYGKGYEIGALNPNEIRQRMGMNPRTDEGGDAYVTPLNMRTTNELPGRTTDPQPDGSSESNPPPAGKLRSL